MDKWIVHKFGGSSVADAGCFRRVAEIVEASPNPREAVVLSACRGVTDALLGLVALAEKPDAYFPSAIEALKKRHVELARSLVSKAAFDGYREQLERDRRVNLSGLGGVGKSSLTIEHIHRQRTAYPDGVFWLRGEATTTLTSDFAALAWLLELKEREEPERRV